MLHISYLFIQLELAPVATTDLKSSTKHVFSVHFIFQLPLPLLFNRKLTWKKHFIFVTCFD